MFTLHDTEVDGVRCFWVETGRPTLAAQLVFRQGMADEPLTESGWLHMLEHLALHGRGGGALGVNGSVAVLHTAFDAHGPADGVVEHLAGVTAWLADPVFHEFERERGVLRAESATRGGTGARAFGWRYGAQGPGVVSHEEPGMGRATPESLTARSRRVFNRRNGALVLDGPPPAGLRLHLPDGEYLRPPAAVPCEDNLPAAYVENGGLTLSGVVARSATATLAHEVLQRALRERLRDHAGAAYAPWATYEPVDQEQALILGGSDVLDDLLPSLVDNLLELIGRIKSQPVPAEWIAEIVEAREQALRDPYSAASLAGRAAHLVLQERPPQTHEEVLEELLATDAGGVQETLTEFCDSLLLGVPGPSAWRDQLPMITFPEGPPRRSGQVFRNRNWPASATRLAVGDGRLELSADGAARSIEVERAAGLFVFEDGTRHLIDEDGWGLTVDPLEWQGGTTAVAALDALVPETLHLPQPARPSSYRPLPAWKRWWLGLRRLLSGDAALIAWTVLLAALVVVGVVKAAPLVIGGAGFALYATVKELRAKRAARRATTAGP